MAKDSQEYKRWLRGVDIETHRIAGVSIHDLADTNTRDMFDDGLTINEAARTILEENDFPFDGYAEEGEE